MNIFKSHFWYNKSQRNGIFFLILLILLLQGFIFFDVFSSDEIIDTNKSKILVFQSQIDSLKAVEIENRKPKIYPFNPNYITDYKGEQLGMSLSEIDRLLTYRKTNKFINSQDEFQQVTKVSDSLLSAITPYFKFPDWVVNQKQNNSSFNKQSRYKNSVISSAVKRSSTDINEATAADFKTISGIGVAFSERIIQYRSKLQGFTFENQLYEVWGLDKVVADKVLSIFKIVDKPIIEKVNVNTVTFKELLKNPYIDYELCKKIFNYRDEVAELQYILELKNIKDFPSAKYDRIVLYLYAN
jgi:DNA uptake protein ComE-like DNA-binding protein